MRTPITVLLLSIVVAGCNSGDVSDQGPECGPGGTCPMGLVCNPRTNRCIAGSTGVDAQLSFDGGPDARPPADAATFDASTRDAATFDASTPDARVADAFTPDGAAPVTMVLTGPPPRTSDLMATFTFSGGVTYRCRIDTAAFATCTSPHMATVTEGAHTFEIVALAGNGLPDPTPETWSWTVDRTGPTVTLAGPAEGSTTGRNVTFTFTVEAGAAVSCSMDSTTLAACAGTTASYTNLSGGVHTFRIAAKDDLGNDGPPITRQFTVDAAGPTVTIAPLTGNLSDPSGTLNYAASEAGSTFECKVNSGAFASCPAAGLAFSGLAPGPNTVAVRATDTHANTGPQASYTWDVLGTVSVLVELGGVPQVGAAVISHRSSGLPTGETKTGADGRVTAKVLPGGGLTAAFLTGRLTVHVLMSMLEVQPGESVILGTRGSPDAATLNVVGQAGDQCCAEYAFSIGGTAVYPSPAGVPPLNGQWAVVDDSYDSTGAVNFLGQALKGDVQRFMPIAGLNVPRGATTTLTVTPGGWQDSVAWPFKIGDMAGYTYFAIEPGVHRNGVAYPIAEEVGSRIGDTTFGTTFHIPAPGFADGRWVRYRLHDPPIFKALVASDIDSIEPATLVPGITDNTLDMGTPERPVLSWTADGSLAAMDGGFVALSYLGGDPVNRGLWLVVIPPGTKLQFPALPDAYHDFTPFEATTISGFISLVDSTAIAGYKAFRGLHTRFLDTATAELGAVLPPPPLIPATSFTTRTTTRQFPPPPQ